MPHCEKHNFVLYICLFYMFSHFWSVLYCMLATVPLPTWYATAFAQLLFLSVLSKTFLVLMFVLHF